VGGGNGDKTTSKPPASDGEIAIPGNASGVWWPDKQCIMDCEYLGLYIVTSVLFIVDQVSRFQFSATAEFFKGFFPG